LELNNKKKIFNIVIVSSILVLVLFIILKIILFFTVLPKEIRELNRNIELPYKFASPMSEYNLDTDKIIHGGGCYALYDSSGNLYIFGGYPDVSSEYKFAEFRTTITDIKLYGFSVGDDLDKAKKELKNHGYKEKIKYGGLYIYYVKGRVKIEIGGSETVNSLQVSLISSNWLMKQFK
jgi:hypothetical protein